MVGEANRARQLLAFRAEMDPWRGHSLELAIDQLVGSPLVQMRAMSLAFSLPRMLQHQWSLYLPNDSDWEGIRSALVEHVRPLGPQDDVSQWLKIYNGEVVAGLTGMRRELDRVLHSRSPDSTTIDDIQSAVQTLLEEVAGSQEIPSDQRVLLLTLLHQLVGVLERLDFLGADSIDPLIGSYVFAIRSDVDLRPSADTAEKEPTFAKKVSHRFFDLAAKTSDVGGVLALGVLGGEHLPPGLLPGF